MTPGQAADMLGRATVYMGDTYQFILEDVYRQTPERRATEILISLKDLIVLITWDEQPKKSDIRFSEIK
jgi:hypothetical protein